MALLKAAVLIALFCLAQGVPAFKKPSPNDLELALTVSSTTTVSGSKQQTVAEVDLILSVWGDYNNSTDKSVVTDFLHQKLSSIQDQDENEEAGVNVMTARNGMPLAFNLTLTESITLGPTTRNIALELDVQVYANTKHRKNTMAMLKHIQPSF